MSHPPPDAERAYPPDEFDHVGPKDGRRGAHRAKPSALLAALPVLFVVLAVVAIIVTTMTVLGDAGEPSSAVPAPTAPSAAAPTAPAPTSSAPTSSAASSAPSSSAPSSSTPSSSTPPEVDTSVPVTVLNGTRRSGLAREATEALQERGWTVPRADNYRGGSTPPTTVFYPREELAATAAAVGEVLGGAATALSDGFGDDGLTVVLGEDYRS
jgi:cytoskeletal protein RodZ